MWKSILLFILSIPLGIAFFFIAWLSFDFRIGLIVGLCAFILINIGALTSFFLIKKITFIDILLPIPFAVIWSLILSIFSLGANLFSAPAAIGSAFFLSLCLYRFYTGNLVSKSFLILPVLIFMYEMLPINIPGPIDDYLSFGGDLVYTSFLYLLPKSNAATKIEDID